MATIRTLAYYPIKGCAAVSVAEAETTAAGLLHDRSFMVVADDGTYRTQRGAPELAVVHPEISTDGDRLTLRAAGIETLEHDVQRGHERCDVTLFGAPFTAIDQGNVVADWFSEFLGQPSRLVCVPPEHHRVTPGQTPGTAAFADGNAILVTALSSLDALNERIVDHGGDPVPMERFRPNLVLDGWDQPHTEDRVRAMTAGDAEVGYARVAVRCVVTTIDQQAGTKAGPEPLRTLAQYRQTADGGVAFGIKASVIRPGKVSVGDEILVHSWGESEL